MTDHGCRGRGLKGLRRTPGGSSMQYSSALQDGHARPAPPSDIGQLAEVLVVLGIAAFALADQTDALNELDRRDPLDHLEAELIFDPKPQRRPVQLLER